MPRKFHALKLMEALLAEQLTNQITFLKLYINLGVMSNLLLRSRTTDYLCSITIFYFKGKSFRGQRLSNFFD